MKNVFRRSNTRIHGYFVELNDAADEY